MPCLFFRGVPAGKAFKPIAVATLYQKVADAVELDISKVEVHIESTQYRILTPDGTLVPAPDVHVFVEWTRRPFEVKQKVATAIDDFLKAHGLGSDITFRDSGPGSFFVNGQVIGPPPSDV